MINIIKLFEKILTFIKDSGSYTLLGTKGSDGTLVLSNNIDNYKFLLIYLCQTSSNAIDGTGVIPVNLFKEYNTTLKAFGINAYNNSNRQYGYINYISDTSVNIQVSSNYNVVIYGIK